MAFFIVCLFLGILVGVVSSLFGIGGGVFIVPLLPTFLNFTTHQAIATSLASVFLVTFINTFSFSRQGLVNWRVGLMLGLPSGLMALISGRWALASGELFLQLMFLAVLILLLKITFFRRKSMRSDFTPQALSWGTILFSMSLAIFAGFVSSFTGIGAGIILSPIMFNLKIVRAKELVPTTNLSTMLTTFSGSLSYFLHAGEESLVDMPMAVGLFVVAMITGHFIRPYQEKMSITTKATVLCFVLLFVIVKQIFKIQALPS